MTDPKGCLTDVGRGFPDDERLNYLREEIGRLNDHIKQLSAKCNYYSATIDSMRDALTNHGATYLDRVADALVFCAETKKG